MLRPRTWNGPAQQPYFLNQNTSLSQGTVFAFGGHSSIDVVSGIRPSITGTALPSSILGNRSTYWASGSGSYYKFATPRQSANLAQGPSTYAFWMTINNPSDDGWAFPASRTGLNATGGGWSFRGNGVSIYFNNYFSGGRMECHFKGFPLNNIPGTMILTYDGGLSSSGVKVYINGVAVTVTADFTGSGSSTSDLTQDLYLGACHIPSFQDNTHLGHMMTTALANRIWTDAEIKQFAQNPNILFRDTPSVSYSFSKPPAVLNPIGTSQVFKGHPVKDAPYRLNSIDPLSKGLVFAHAGHNNIELIGGIRPTATSVTEATSFGKRGSAFTGGAINASKLDFGNNIATANLHLGPSTWAFFALSNDGTFVPATQNDGNSVNAGWQLSERSGENKLGFEAVSSSTDLRRGISETIPTGVPFTAVWTYDGSNLSNHVKIYLNGALGTQAVNQDGAGSQSAATTHPMLLGQKQYGIVTNGSHNGQIYVALMANRIWTDAEVRLFHQDPYRVFQPAKSPIYILNINTSTGLLGEADITFAGSGTLTALSINGQADISFTATATGQAVAAAAGQSDIAFTASATITTGITNRYASTTLLPIVPAHTIALWQFQDNKDDSSGHILNMSIETGTEQYTDLVAGSGIRAFNFNGSTSLIAPTDPAFELTGDMTIQWLGVRANNADEYFFSYQSVSSGHQILYGGAMGTGRIVWVNHTTVWELDFHGNTAGVPHLYTFIRKDNVIRFFVDDNQVGISVLIDNNNTPVGDEVFRFGGNVLGPSNIDKIASVRVLDVARTDEEILFDYRNSLANNADILVPVYGSITGAAPLTAPTVPINFFATSTVVVFDSGQADILFDGTAFLQGLTPISGEADILFAGSATGHYVNIAQMHFTATGAAPTGTGVLLAQGHINFETGTSVLINIQMFANAGFTFQASLHPHEVFGGGLATIRFRRVIATGQRIVNSDIIGTSIIFKTHEHRINTFKTNRRTIQ